MKQTLNSKLSIFGSHRMPSCRSKSACPLAPLQPNSLHKRRFNPRRVFHPSNPRRDGLCSSEAELSESCRVDFFPSPFKDASD